MNLIKKRRELKKWKIHDFFIEFYFGLYFKYPICCITQWSFEQRIIPVFLNTRKCKISSHGYTHNNWFRKLSSLGYVPCSFHVWRKIKEGT